MEFRRLRYFLAAADRMNFTTAAKCMEVSEPAISRQVRMLEEEIGVRLFERKKGRIQLTPSAIAFRAHARAALHEAAAAVSDARMVRNGEAGCVAIGFVTTAALVILPKLLNRFRSRFPHARVELCELDPEAQVTALKENNIGIGLASVSHSLPDLECRLLAREKLIVALPAQHPASHCRAIDLKDLSKERFLLPPRGSMSGICEKIIEACHRAGFDPQHTLPTRNAETALFLTAGNLGIALIPQSFRRLKVSGVVYRPLEHDIVVTNMYGIRRKESESTLVDNFWSVLESIY
jgi:DNA-binding transcriptional LysR family regulator